MHIDSKECLKKQQVINYLATDINISNQEAERIFDALINILKNAFNNGINVDLGSDFGFFCVKYQKGYENENSPRIPKTDRYTIVFKPSKKLKSNLKQFDISDQTK